MLPSDFTSPLITLFSLTALADNYVDPYVKQDGTFVQGHFKTDPNSTRNDNYSTRGNINPYTGEPGTKPRDNEFMQEQQPSSGRQMDIYDSRLKDW